MFYRLVLCGLLLDLLIVGYSQPLRAEGLISDVDTSTDSIGEVGEPDVLFDPDVSSESEEVYDFSDEEFLDDTDISSEGDFNIDSDDLPSIVEDNTEEGLLDSDYTIDIGIDYEALTESITEAIIAADEEVAALNDSSYDGTISTTYLSLFTGIYLKYANPSDDYLLYRADQYTYNLVIGDLTVAGTTFSGTGCTIVSIYARTSTGYTPTYNVYSDDILVTADNYYCYSNLGDFAPIPDLAKLLYEQQIIFVGVFIGLMIFIHGLIIFRKGD